MTLISNQSPFFYVISWLTNFYFLSVLGIGGLIVLCCFPVIYILGLVKPQWMPEKTAYLTSLKVINGWLVLVLSAMFFVSLACVLEALVRVY
ncbi:MAG: hypothetical protein HC784_03650 [Hydrococcus sp. CSU_1_8]|nr:hypothetical protein [Hydrococcus sp. CSU_1_8]